MVTGYMMMNALRMPRNESTLVTAQTALMKANQALGLIDTGYTRFVRTFNASSTGLLSDFFGTNTIAAGTLFELCLTELCGSAQAVPAGRSVSVTFSAIDNNPQFMPMCIVTRGAASTTDDIFIRGMFCAGITNTAGNSAAGSVVTSGGTLTLTASQVTIEIFIYDIVAESDVTLMTT